MSEEEILRIVRSLDERLHRLEDLPSSLDRLSTAIESHTKTFANAVPLPVFQWTFIIVALLIGGTSAIKVLVNLFGVSS